MSSIVTWTRAHRLTAFFALTFLVTWCVWPLWMLGLFIAPMLPAGPLVAALVVIALTDGAAGFRELGARLIRWRVGWLW
jgi:hypothetical protein